MGEYLAEAVKFSRMAEEEKNPDVKAAMIKQAAAYRKLAADRAKKLGVPLPEMPPKETSGSTN
jgi:hypothetical protein